MNFSRNLKIKIILFVIGTVLIGAGAFIASNTVFKSKPKPPMESIGFENLDKEATGLANTKGKPKNKESKEAVKGTTQYIPPKNYQPTAKSKATAKKVTQAKQVIKKPEEKQSLPDISEPSPTTDYPFSDEHVQGFIDNNNEYQDILDQMDVIYLQSLALYQKYLDVPETIHQRTRGTMMTASQVARLIEAEEERLLHELDVLELEYLKLEYRLDHLDYELCSTYWDILYYLGYESYCF